MEKKRLEEALENPDIDFTANVKARELRFDEVPETKVRFWGDLETDSVSGTERENLPEEVRQGTVYRDISVKLRIASGLVDNEVSFSEKAKEEWR